MPIDWLTLLAAWLSGLLGSVHCAAMCGGIATGFSAMSPQGGWKQAVQVNLGRVGGYVLAGAIVGGFGAGLLRVLRIDALALGLRMAVGLVLVGVAVRLLDPRGRLDFLPKAGARFWRRLRPLQARLQPADRAWRRIVLGMLWGWLPCGLSMSLLTAAWLQATAYNGALTMAAFGLGTLPMMIPLTWSGARIGRRLQQRPVRLLAAMIILLAGVVTLASPWLMQVPALHQVLVALGCGPVAL